jgi:serine protease Do
MKKLFGGTVQLIAFAFSLQLLATPAIFGATEKKNTKASPAPAPTVPTDDPMLGRVFPSIVRIEAIRLRPSDGRLTKQWSGGSGVIISAGGHVLTNCHVTEDGDFFRCYLYDGTHVEARLVGQDAMTDISVLQLDLSQRPKNAAPLVIGAFGDSDKLLAGEAVFALGSPGFLAQSVTRGIVANASLVLPEQTAGKMILRGEDVGMLVRWILHDARIFGGNSGGPLVNDRGEIIGINELGVFNLSGAIPGNLARAVATQLIAQGRVTRGWSGLTVQPRLESDGPGTGVIVADVTPGSPAAESGLQPGDLIVACDAHAIEGAEEKAVAHYYRLETGRLPGQTFSIDYFRAGQRQTAKVNLAQRPPAQAENTELRSWGAVVRDLTPLLARDERLPDTAGVWPENIRPAGPCGQAEPEIRRQDVLLAVENEPVTNVASLTELTKKLFANAPGGTRTVLATFRRDGAIFQSIVELREASDRNPTPQARKAWLGVLSQPLTPKLGTRLGIKSEGGARITRVHPGSQAEAAGLLIGDVILELDGNPVTARRPEDSDVLARQIRQYKAGTQAIFTLWRQGNKIKVPVSLEAQPTPAAELPWWEDLQLEFSVRDVAFDDRVRLQLSARDNGVLVESAAPAGWASLAGLRNDDLILTAGGTPVTTVAELRRAREDAVRAQREWWVLLVRRRGQTAFIEIKLTPAKT